jgi:hypothetical protein
MSFTDAISHYVLITPKKIANMIFEGTRIVPVGRICLSSELSGKPRILQKPDLGTQVVTIAP